jgi:hypothetical protein
MSICSNFRIGYFAALKIRCGLQAHKQPTFWVKFFNGVGCKFIYCAILKPHRVCGFMWWVILHLITGGAMRLQKGM